MSASQKSGRNQSYQSIVETIDLLTGLSACIWLTDGGRKTLKIIAATGLSKEYISESVLRLDEPSVASEVFKTRQTVIVPNIASDDRWKYKSEFAAMGFGSAMVVPLQIENKIVGVLDVYTHGNRRFGEWDKTILKNYASQIELTIKAERRKTTLERLLEADHKIEQLITKQPKVVLEEIVKAACEVIVADCAVLYPYDSQGGDFYDIESTASYGLREQLKISERPRRDTGMAARVKRDGEVIISNIKKDNPGMLSDSFIKREGVRAFMGIALKVATDVLGILYVDFRAPHAFDEEELDTIRLFAYQAALAIHNSRSYQQAKNRVQERVDDIGALQDIYALIGIASLEDVLKQIAEEAARLTPAKYTGVWLVDERAHKLRFGAMNERELAPTQDWPEISLDETSINTHVVQTGKLYRCDDVNKDSHYQMWYEDVRSELTVPLRYGGRVIGTLNLESTRLGAFTDDHMRLVKALAEAAAVAIHSARLYKDIRTVNEVGQTLTSGIRLHENEILELIRKQAGTLMDTDNMYIALYDGATDTVQFGLAFKEGKPIKVATRKAGKGRTEWIIREREHIFIDTEAKAQAWYEQPGRQEYTKSGYWPSWIGVPMMVGEKMLGVIVTYHPTRDHVYSGDDLAILQALASQAAIALDNARLYYNVNPRLQVLVDVGQTLSSGIQLKESGILKLIYGQAQELTGTRDMYVALYNKDTEEISFELAMKNGEPVEVGIGGWTTRKANMQERGKTEEIILTGEPILHSTFQESRDWYEHLGRKEFLGDVQASYLAVPMSIGEKILGVLAIYDWKREYAYSESDQAILSSMAGQAAIALDNARLYEELQLQLERKKGDILASREIDIAITDRIRPGPELQNVLELILDKALERTGALSGNIMWYDEVAGDLVMRVGRGVLEGKEGSRQNIGEGIVGLVAQERKTYRVGNVHEAPWKGTYIPFISNVRSELATPLVDAETLLGVLNVEDPRIDAFDEEDIRWLEDLAVRVVIAIRGAEAYEALQKEQRKNMAAGRLATVSAVASGFVHRMNNVAGTIPVRVGQIKELLDQNDVHYAKFAHYLKAINEDVDGILKTAQAIRTSKTEEPLELVDVDTLVSTALQRIVVPSRVTVFNRCDGNLPQVLVFSGQLVNTLENLIRNGIEAIDGSGMVTIMCRALVKDGQEWVMIGVEDTGSGIAPADLDRIFDLFYSTKSGGMGFALWKAKTLIESLGGRIEVSSEPGEGTTFTILLPVEREVQK